MAVRRWGLDARIGWVTRSHGDVEFWVERSDAARSRVALVGAGSTALATQPAEEACEFRWDKVDFSTAYFDRRADGNFDQPAGRFSDWMFPPDSFRELPGSLDGLPVPAMSVAGMLAMKVQFPTLRNGRPWRDKDIEDIATLRELLAPISELRLVLPRSPEYRDPRIDVDRLAQQEQQGEGSSASG